MDMDNGRQKISVRTSPSLALIKYWGKADAKQNLPDTSSLAISLEGLYTETDVSLTTEKDTVVINGVPSFPERYTQFFEHIREKLGVTDHFHVESRSNFPTAAGLASSSSGFAALAYGCVKILNSSADINLISDLARIGSASAARAVFEGFTILEKKAFHAQKLFGKDYWPELRIIIAVVKGESKKTSSRTAMELARKTSPYYKTWLEESELVFKDALKACSSKDLDTLGPLIRKSYLMMFSTMFTSCPPVLYWEPESIALIKECEALRNKGYSAWETMDAGPQVKILCLENQSAALIKSLKEKFPRVDFLLSQVGEGPTLL